MLASPTAEQQANAAAGLGFLNLTVAINGTQRSALDCFVRALELDQNHPFVWRNVAKCVPEALDAEDALADDAENIDDDEASKAKKREEALAKIPTVLVGEHAYTRRELLDEAHRCQVWCDQREYNLP